MVGKWREGAWHKDHGTLKVTTSISLFIGDISVRNRLRMTVALWNRVVTKNRSIFLLMSFGLRKSLNCLASEFGGTVNDAGGEGLGGCTGLHQKMR